MRVSKRLTPVLILIAALGLLWFSFTPPREPDQAILTKARLALRSGQYQNARELTGRVTDPALMRDAALIAGESAARLREFENALTHYERAASVSKTDADRARCRLYAAEVAMQLQWFARAESDYRAAAVLDPGSTLADDRLETLLRLQGRLLESRDILRRRVVENSATVEQLLSYGHPDRLRQFGDLLSTVPDRPEAGTLHRIGLARDALAARNPARAIELSRAISASDNTQLDAQIVLGTALLESVSEDVIPWLETLSNERQQHPSVLNLKGLFAEQKSAWPAAARAFSDCLAVEPSSRPATVHLSTLLDRLQQPAAAIFLHERAKRIPEIEAALDNLQSDTQPLENLVVLIPLLIKNGRYAEARNWRRLGLQRFGAALPASITQFAIPTPDDDRAELLAVLDAAGRTSWPVLDLTQLTEPTERIESAAVVAFERRVGDSGFAFSFVNAPTESPTRMVQSNGGGVGIIDADQDGWPDVWMTQGGAWPNAGAMSVHDQLFRNIRGRAFSDCGPAAGVEESGFSQGIAVGDYDADGFPDVFVACVGASRLFRNLGDGTFEDVSARAGMTGETWATSCLFADLNADGLDDLYVVNYLSLSDAAAELCHDGGKLRRCDRTEFTAADDTLLLNSGDGSFRDVSSPAGILQPDGRGMGAVAADFNGDKRLDVFVANDAVPNFLFLQTPAAQSATSNTGHPVFDEAAAVSGVAVDGNGVPQACMGIALSDFDANEQPDLFVTNFLHESNTMYLGLGSGLFADRTPALQLAQPSIGLLGFGTQAVDADLDGDDDLVVLNGHLDDLSAAGVPFRMPAQIFLNRNGRVFELQSNSSGFFGEDHLGRSLATLDWNRDGRPDLVAGLLEEPSCVLENQTLASGRALQLRLIGTRASRLAAGTAVTVIVGDRRLQRFVGTGGYQASNEHLLTIGLGNHPGTISVQIDWCDGSTSESRPFDTTLPVTIIQGRESSPLTMPK